MSLLIIRCPRMPFLGGGSVGFNAETAGDLLEVVQGDFHWYLFEKYHVDATGNHASSGIGPISEMPYAEQVIVLLPTLDVRLITMKIPMVSDEKLRVIMPGLIEEHLLSSVDQFEAQIIRPFDGAPALERTVAVIDKGWLEWLSAELSQLVSPHIRLIPDCYLLKPIKVEGTYSPILINDQPSIAYEVDGDYIIWTVRLADQTGASWIDQISTDSSSVDIDSIKTLVTYLPSYLRTQTVGKFNFESDWFKNSAQQFSEASSNDGINLLPESFKLTVSKQAGLTIAIDRSDVDSDEYQYVHDSWQTIKKLVILFLLGIFSGLILFALIGTAINLGWQYQMKSLITSHITGGSIEKVSVSNSSTNNDQLGSFRIYKSLEINQFLNEVRLKKRNNGLSSKDDFPNMVADLHRLMSIYGNQLVKSIEYDGSSIEFVVDTTFLESRKITSFDLVSQAVSMNMALIAMGGSRYKLLPYAGLGAQ